MTNFSPPPILVDPNGNRIHYPTGRSSPISEAAVVGVDVCLSPMEPICQVNKDYNEAMELYHGMRPHLLNFREGKWAAIHKSGVIHIANSHAEACSIMEPVFGISRNTDYFCQCIGREALGLVVMDGETTKAASTAYPELQSGCSILWSHPPSNELLLGLEHSFGADFPMTLRTVKFDPGASLVGVPLEVLSNPPTGHVPRRSHDEIYVSPNGSREMARTYEGHVFRLKDKSVTTRVIQSRTWLMGYPFLKEFEWTINYQDNPPLKFTVLSEKEEPRQLDIQDR